MPFNVRKESVWSEIDKRVYDRKFGTGERSEMIFKVNIDKQIQRNKKHHHQPQPNANRSSYFRKKKKKELTHLWTEAQRSVWFQ